MNTDQLRTLFLATLVVLSIVAMVTTFAGTASADENACTTTVVHDEFLTNQTLQQQVGDGGRLTTITENTKVAIAEDGGFYRVTGTNPNAYCVRFVVQVGALAIPPTNMPNEVEAINSSHTATWQAVHNFSADQSYTRIEFTLPADTTAQWAPNKYRVMTLSWTSKSTRKSASFVDRVTSKVTGPDLLEEKTRTITVNESTTVTVPLVHPETGERIQDWQASYSTDGENWVVVPDSTDQPVYVRTIEGGDAVQFTFNDPEATVRFTANPNSIDKLQQDVDAFTSGPAKLPDLLGLGTIAPMEVR